MKKEKSIKSDKRSWSAARLWMGSIMAALVAAIVMFAVMLRLEKNVLTQYERGTIYVAAKEIPKGQLVTKENWINFMEKKELDKSCIPKTAISSEEQIQNLWATFDIETGVLLTRGMFGAESNITKNMKEPVIAGFKAEDLYQVAGGTLRAGDRIHIYCVKDEEGLMPVWSDVFVYQVFDNAGNIIPNGDTTTAAQRINVYLDKANVEEFYSQLALGTLRVVKVCE